MILCPPLNNRSPRFLLFIKVIAANVVDDKINAGGVAAWLVIANHTIHTTARADAKILPTQRIATVRRFFVNTFANSICHAGNVLSGIYNFKKFNVLSRQQEVGVKISNGI
jgi:hypothetical protein